ncbi:4804_t:CDS:1, partial [Funneliformis geosporum]
RSTLICEAIYPCSTASRYHLKASLKLRVVPLLSYIDQDYVVQEDDQILLLVDTEPYVKSFIVPSPFSYNRPRLLSIVNYLTANPLASAFRLLINSSANLWSPRVDELA